MAKKDKIALNRSDDMEAVDAELSAAMETLDSTNNRVVEILETYAPPPESEPDEPEMQDSEAVLPDGSAEPQQGEQN